MNKNQLVLSAFTTIFFILSFTLTIIIFAQQRGGDTMTGFEIGVIVVISVIAFIILLAFIFQMIFLGSMRKSHKAHMLHEQEEMRHIKAIDETTKSIDGKVKAGLLVNSDIQTNSKDLGKELIMREVLK